MSFLPAVSPRSLSDWIGDLVTDAVRPLAQVLVEGDCDGDGHAVGEVAGDGAAMSDCEHVVHPETWQGDSGDTAAMPHADWTTKANRESLTAAQERWLRLLGATP